MKALHNTFKKLTLALASVAAASAATVALSSSSLFVSDALALKSMTREEIEVLAKPIVHYSYWWGHGQWRMDGKQPGHCSGSCGACTHSGGIGADCSGFVGKAWQVPSPISVSAPHHPYNTGSFHGSNLHWTHILKKSSKAMDALVHDSGGSGHIVLYKKGNPYGGATVYECGGCSIGCKYNVHSIDASYAAIRRNAVTDFLDKDKDGISDKKDNCKTVKNKSQSDLDKDGKGDACDNDIDGDKIANEKDNCPHVKNPGQENTDGGGPGNACDKDDDNDGIPDLDSKGKPKDNCKNVPNKDQKDTDKDKKGDACDDDDDKDAVKDAGDNCDTKPNKDQKDTDGDKIGNVCDDDDDGDGIKDKIDNCPLNANPGQEDLDDDTDGDVCDKTDDRTNPLGVAVSNIISSATPNDPTGAVFDVCVGKPVTFGFTLTNVGSAGWELGGDGAQYGGRVSLATAVGTPDPITNQVTAALPGPVSPTSKVAITFAGKAPAVPGQYVSQWRVIDQKAGGFGQPFQVTFNVGACTPPAPQPAVVEPEPDPVPSPSPSDPDPKNPSPSDPDPTDPDPTDPTPANPDPSDPDPTPPNPDEPDPNDDPEEETDPSAGAGGKKASTGTGNGKAGAAGKANRSSSSDTVVDQGGCQASAAPVSSTSAGLLVSLLAALPLLRRRRAPR